jgi:hypothetical protein
MADNYISFEQYRQFCQHDGEADRSAQDSLAVHLHSLGIALNYKDDPRLRDTHVLNPHWVTNGIYTLLNAPELADTQRGTRGHLPGRTPGSSRLSPRAPRLLARSDAQIRAVLPL